MAAMTGAVSPNNKSFSQWLRGRKGQQVMIMTLFMAIPLILLFTFTYLPFAEMIGFSFYDMKYVGARKFVGWKNYASVFSRQDCFGALKLSLYYMAGSIVQLVLSLYLATVLSFKVKGGNIFKGFMFFPYLINGIAIGFIFKFFYTRGFVFDTVLQWCGFQLDNLPYWLKDQSINNFSLVGTSVWRYFGQNMVLFIGAIMSVDGELYEEREPNKSQKKTGKMVPIHTLRNVSRIKEISEIVHANGGKVAATCVVCNPWILDKLEPYADALTFQYTVSPVAMDHALRAQLDVLSGDYNPTGKMSLTMVSCMDVIAITEQEIDGVMREVCASPNDVPGYDKDQYIDPAILSGVKGGSYAYCDADGNYYRCGFGLDFNS